MTQTIRKRFTADLGVEHEQRTVLAKISTANVDREGEVLIPQGCDATDFFQSPTVFFNHDYTMPVGKCMEITRYPDRLEAKTVFAKRPENHHGEWLADTLLSLFQQGVVRGFSVGFVPVEGRRPSKKDRATFGDKVKYVYSKWKLLEYSIAPLPANQNALALAVSKGILSSQTASDLFGQTSVLSRGKRVMFIVSPPRKPVAAQLQKLSGRQLQRLRGQLYQTP